MLAAALRNFRFYVILLFRDLDLCHLLFGEFAVGNWAGLPALFELTGLRLLDRNDEDFLVIGVLFHPSAGAIDCLSNEFLTYLHEHWEIVRRVAEFAFRIQVGFESVGQVLKTDGGEQYAA